jgi:hypothetical protein
VLPLAAIRLGLKLSKRIVDVLHANDLSLVWGVTASTLFPFLFRCLENTLLAETKVRPKMARTLL